VAGDPNSISVVPDKEPVSCLNVLTFFFVEIVNLEEILVCGASQESAYI
jgi:hypothetical protein